MATSNQNRRQFLKTSTLGLSILGVESTFPSWIFPVKSLAGEQNNLLPVAGEGLHIIRDTITLDNVLLEKLTNKAISQGLGKIILSARRTIVKENINVENIELVFISNEFLGNNQTIKMLTPSREPNEFSSAGFDGKNLTIIAQNLSNIRLESAGTNGIGGINGENMKDNGEGSACTRPTRGQNGGNGGSGGNFIIIYSNSSQNETISSIGGQGGEGGKGGSGGKCCVAYKNVRYKCDEDGDGHWEWCYKETCSKYENLAKAPNGVTGAKGNDGTIQKNQVSRDNWFATAAQYSNLWNEYKVNVADYYYRAINNPNLDTVEGLETSESRIRLALNEIADALKLNPNNAKALLLYQRILNFHTPFGNQRRVDIYPEFEKFEQTYLGYYNVVTKVNEIANIVYQNADFTNNLREILVVEQNSVNVFSDNLSVLINQKIVPLIKEKEIEIDKRTKDDKETDRKINLRKEELENKPFSIGDLVSTIGVVINVVSAAFTAGATLVSAAQGFMTILKSGKGILDSLDDIKGLKDIKDTIGDYVDVSKGKKKVAEIDNALAKKAWGLKEAVNNFNKDTKTFDKNLDIVINFEKTINDLKNATVNDAEMKKLLSQKAENYKELLIAKKDLDYLLLDKKVAELQKSNFDVVTQSIKESKQKFDTNTLNSYLEYCFLVKRSQSYMDFLMQQVFYAARSLEILQFQEHSDKIRYDFGYVHPDLVENLLAFPEPLYGNELSREYNRSWIEFFDVSKFRTLYNDFSDPKFWTEYTLRLSFANDIDIKGFKENSIYRMPFRVESNHPTMKDKKYPIIQGVKIAFVGAKAENQVFNAKIYQSGSLSQRILDNSIVEKVLESRLDNISDAQTKKLSSDEFKGFKISNSFDNSLSMSYRPVFGYYELYIDQSEIDAFNINLAELKEIQIWFKVKYRNV